MGLLFWKKPKPSPPPPSSSPSPSAAVSGGGKSGDAKSGGEEAEGMNGAMEVRRAAEVTVFEFGQRGGEPVTIAGFCPVSEELEPCRWEIVPAKEDNAPQFRIVF